MPLVKDIIEALEELAPRRLAEDWDNVGLQVGDVNAEVRRVVVAVDCDEGALEAALAPRRRAQLIITHHPLLFKPLSSLEFSTPKGAFIKELVKHDLACYALHTNADNSLRFSASRKLAAMIGLENLVLLGLVAEDALVKIIAPVPADKPDELAARLLDLGVRRVEVAAVPQLVRSGKTGLDSRSELAISFECARADLAYYRKRLEQLLGGAVPLSVIPLETHNQTYGAGVVGKLKQLTSLERIAELLTAALGSSSYALGGAPERKVQHVAICSGSGGSFVGEAAAKGAELFITGEIDFHRAQDALQLGLSLLVLQHAISEFPTAQAIQDYLRKQFPQLAIDLSLPKEPLQWYVQGGPKSEG